MKINITNTIESYISTAHARGLAPAAPPVTQSGTVVIRRLSVRFSLAVLPLAAALLAGACGGIISPSENQIDEFSGSVDPLGEGPLHEFQVSRNGEFEIRLSALDPPTAYLTVALGRFAAGSCQQQLGVWTGTLNEILLTGLINTGRHCVLVFDEGFITDRVSYTVRVSHP